MLTWEDDEVTIPEGDDRQLCYNANIGSAVPYVVEVTASGKGSNPADGKSVKSSCLSIMHSGPPRKFR